MENNNPMKSDAEAIGEQSQRILSKKLTEERKDNLHSIAELIKIVKQHDTDMKAIAEKIKL